MSARKQLTTPGMITIMLILQFVPMVLFPPESFSSKSQEWWLPIILAFLAVISIVQIFRRSIAIWPWHMIGFAQGFNIISRLMMLFPHATVIVDGVQVLNTLYVVLTVISMLLSVLLLWYMELPEVRMGFLAK
jgi:hypothetical protein